MELDPDAAIKQVVDTFKRIRVAVHRLGELGFHEAVIATDHGFVLHPSTEPGDVCPRPPGTWLNQHDRCLLGDGQADAATFMLPAGFVGVRGDFTQVAGPRALVAYRAGVQYFHGGASLPETVVPVIAVRLQAAQSKRMHQPTVAIHYESLLGPYLRGATEVVIEDPYIRQPHQVQNLVRFCEAVVKSGTVRKLRLVTSYEHSAQQDEVKEKLADLQQSLLEVDVQLEVAWNQNLHDRELRLNNGWVVKIGRGLDIYQRPASWFEIGANDMTLRKCLETKVDIFRATERNG